MLTNFQTKYRIQCKIGEGSFSDVLRCQNRETGQVVAAKRLKQFFPSTAEAEEIPEVIAMKKLPHHPNILHLIESHFEPLLGKVTLIFDIMDMSIYDMIKTRKRPVPEAKVKNYLYQILKGIAHLHNHGVFHRDIKPENILIKGETIKIADLGSVRGIYSRKPYTEYISTRWYRSPECLLTSGYYGPKMDVWAAGCVFYELLTLKPLFPGSNEIDQISKIHVVLGTPSQSLLSRLKRKSQHADINFPQKAGTGFGCLLQNISEGGREILKMMLIYDPKLRSATRRLLENRYFNDLREYDLLKQRLSISQTFSSSTTEWRNPVLLSFMTSERKRKQKQVNVMKSKVPRPIQSLTTNKQKIPSGIRQTLTQANSTINKQKISLSKVVRKCDIKPQLVKRDEHKIQTSLLKPTSQILQETTSTLHLTSNNSIWHSSNNAETNKTVQNNLSSPRSFLPILAMKQQSSQARKIPLPRKSSSILSATSITQRQKTSKSVITTTSSKPRLEPILERGGQINRLK